MNDETDSPPTPPPSGGGTGTDSIHNRMMGRTLAGFVALSIVGLFSGLLTDRTNRQLVIFVLLGYIICMVWTLYLSKRAVQEESDQEAAKRAHQEAGQYVQQTSGELHAVHATGLSNARDRVAHARGVHPSDSPEYLDHLLQGVFVSIRKTVAGPHSWRWVQWSRPIPYNDVDFKLQERLESLGYEVLHLDHNFEATDPKKPHAFWISWN